MTTKNMNVRVCGKCNEPAIGKIQGYTRLYVEFCKDHVAEAEVIKNQDKEGVMKITYYEKKV